MTRFVSRAALAAVALIPLSLTGCWSHPRASWESPGWTSYDDGWVQVEPPEPERPRLHLSDAEIDAALAGRAAGASAPPTPASRARTLAAAVAEVVGRYRLGERDAADAVVAESPRLYAWDDPDLPVVITCRYTAAGGGGIELSIERSDGERGGRPDGEPTGRGAGETLAVAFAPGTYAEPLAGTVEREGDTPGEPRWTDPFDEERFGHWPPAQDLALLRAPVLVLPAGAREASVRLPICCASFRLGAPVDQQPFRLARFARGSAIDRLMVALCADVALRDPAAAQMAVWMCRDDLGWEEFLAQGGAWGRLVTFGDQGAVLPRHAQGAAEVLLDAGIDPRRARFFGEVEDEDDAAAPLAPPPVEPPAPSVEPPAPGLEPAPPEASDLS